MARQVKKSKGREKTKNKIAKIHYKIACVRKDQAHKLTTKIAKNHGVVGIEDLSVQNMIKNHNLAGAIANGAWATLRTMLEYKCKKYGTKLVIADRFFASTKTCSSCGHKQEMPLK